MNRKLYVERSEYDRVVDALNLAYHHIISHHAINVMEKLEWGCFCPACHHLDGSEPEMDKIVSVINYSKDIDK
jgi:hypothetical protein